MKLRVKETLDTATAAVSTGVKRSWQALFAGVTQLLGSLILVTVGGVGLAEINTNQWLIISAAVLGSVGVIYGLTNKGN